MCNETPRWLLGLYSLEAQGSCDLSVVSRYPSSGNMIGPFGVTIPYYVCEVLSN